ncbi:MAG: hypothetical protein V7647_4153 [Acidobacteriota bacterium]|jgi:hypothetical protein
MKIQRLLIGLTVLNLTLAVLAIVQARHPLMAESAPSVLRGRALEIVDDRGEVRASLSVLPAQAQRTGGTSPETVLLRLITERGRPSVKISASEEASGVSLAGPSNTKDTYIIVEAKGTASSLRLRNEDGREQVVKP